MAAVFANVCGFLFGVACVGTMLALVVVPVWWAAVCYQSWRVFALVVPATRVDVIGIGRGVVDRVEPRGSLQTMARVAFADKPGAEFGVWFDHYQWKKLVTPVLEGL